MRMILLFFILILFTLHPIAPQTDQSQTHVRVIPEQKPLPYDEQAGVTFADNFTELTAFVVATPLTDSDGFGPAFLLNGLTDNGWWYQVGVAYNWPNGNLSSPIQGFSLVYGAYSPFGESTLPSTSASNELMAILPLVKSGDVIRLTISLNGSLVYLSARDLTSGGYSQLFYNSSGASKFIGLQEVSNKNGYFTGVMTEWYRGNYGFSDLAEGQADYWLGEPISRATLWAEEYAVQNSSIIYSSASGVLSLPNSGFTNISLGPLMVRANGLHVITGSLQIYMSNIHTLGTNEYVLPQLSYLPAAMAFNVTSIMMGSVWGGIPPYTYSVYVDGKISDSGYLLNAPPLPTNFSIFTQLGMLRPGNHTYYMVVTDSTGNTVTSPQFEVGVIQPTAQQEQNICAPHEQTLSRPSIITNGSFIYENGTLIVIYNNPIPNYPINSNGTVYIIGNPFQTFGQAINVGATPNDTIPGLSCQLNAVVPSNSSSVYLGYGVWFDPHDGAYYLNSNINSIQPYSLLQLYAVFFICLVASGISFLYFKLSHTEKAQSNNFA